MSIQTVTIEKLVFGGAGLARTGEGIVFVNDVAPGETVEIEFTGKKGGVAFARPKKILTASTARRTPACPLYGRCGGCDWLHIDYQTQVECKKEMTVECMRRIGHVKEYADPEVQTADEHGYRRRAQLQIDRNGFAGFFARRTNDVVPVRRCPLLVDALNALIGEIADGSITLPPSIKNLKTVAGDDDSAASSPLIAGKTTESVKVTVGNKTFEVPGSGFFQNNSVLLERLGAWAHDHVEGAFCVDLYGGSGFFSVMVADRFKEGVLIESVGAEAAAARKNFNRNGIAHIRALEGTAEDLVMLAGNKAVDCLIVDPPRPGLTPRAREAAAALKPKAILYVSCDPSTQARDAGFFVNKEGYKISSAALFDLYPNTHHIESLLLLKRSE
ncbi:MAG: class I SAM-dependent RNA methyltransferase [Chitinispirillaceae bacterium]|nr:class I SAM-dependent RNA methyltransferase [Chitinispirillaceae bacterium]